MGYQSSASLTEAVSGSLSQEIVKRRASDSASIAMDILISFFMCVILRLLYSFLSS